MTNSVAGNKLWRPDSPTPGLEVDAGGVELHDSDILAFERGPLAYAKDKSGSSMSIDQFVRDMEEQFNHCGFRVEVQVYDTHVPGAYAFKFQLLGRINSSFDPDRQVHEVVNNILDMPGETKGHVINTTAAMNEMWKEHKDKHNHIPDDK